MARHPVLGTDLQGPWPDGHEVAVLGLGCFWGAERRFWTLEGVHVTAVGYAGGDTERPSYSEVCRGDTMHAEVVLVVYDPARLHYERIIARFWESHDPTQGMRQGNDVGTQYRSGIYYDNPEHGEIANAMIRQMSQDKLFGAPITTEVKPLSNYSTAEAYHQDYFANHPNAGYCAFVVGPKVEKFRKTFARYLKGA